MDKLAIRESILKAVTQELDEWLEEEGKITDAFQYEHRLLQRTLKMGQAMLQGSGGSLSRDRNKKKRFDDFRQGARK